MEELIGTIADIKFFQERKEIKPSDFRDLVTAFQYTEVGEKNKVIKYGEPGENFYVILSGKVSVMVPNPAIRKWKYHYKRFDDLQRWHHLELVPLIDKARQKFFTAFPLRKGGPAN